MGRLTRERTYLAFSGGERQFEAPLRNVLTGAADCPVETSVGFNCLHNETVISSLSAIFDSLVRRRSRAADPTSEAFFEACYQKSEDPWRFSSSSYEINRYQSILDALPPGSFERAFEPGCSIGVLTEQLAGRCRNLLALDISATAVVRARERCGRYPHVQIRHGALPDDLPEGHFDLVIFSEIGYYFREERLEKLTATLVARLTPGGIFLASHWLGKSPDHILPGDTVHDVIGATAKLNHLVSARPEGFRLDVWARP